MHKLIFILLLCCSSCISLFSQKKDTTILIGQRNTPAEFPTGRDAMFKFISENLIYPDAPTNNINVFVSFSVEIDGNITDIKVVKGSSKDYDEAAKKVISIMPKWKPALENGMNKPIKSYYTVPIKFLTE